MRFILCILLALSCSAQAVLSKSKVIELSADDQKNLEATYKLLVIAQRKWDELLLEMERKYAKTVTTEPRGSYIGCTLPWKEEEKKAYEKCLEDLRAELDKQPKIEVYHPKEGFPCGMALSYDFRYAIPQACPKAEPYKPFPSWTWK